MNLTPLLKYLITFTIAPNALAASQNLNTIFNASGRLTALKSQKTFRSRQTRASGSVVITSQTHVRIHLQKNQQR